MKRKILLVNLFWITLLAVTSCDNEERRGGVSTDCIQLNDSSVSYFNKFHGQDSSMLDSAIRLINMALACDSTYFMAYHNKVVYLTQMHNYLAVIETLDKMMNLTDHDEDLLAQKGKMYKMLGLDSLAKLNYHASLRKYNSLLKVRPDDMDLITGKIIVYYELYGRGKTLKKLDSLMTKYPDEELLMGLREEIENSANDTVILRN